MSIYPLGNTVTLNVTFLDHSELAFDPDSVVFEVMRPGRSLLTPTASKDAVGYYHCEVVADTPGNWKYRAYGTNPNVASEGHFEVRDSAFG